jgi:hypothetical protein
MFPHSSFQTAGANPGPRTVSLDLPGLFKHPLSGAVSGEAPDRNAHLGDKGILKGRIVLDEAFTEAALRDALVKRSYRVFHVASHFKLAADPTVAIRINLVQSRCNRSILN